MSIRSISPFVCLFLFASCNSISSGHFVLTDDNSEAMEHHYPYWFSPDPMKHDKPFYIEGFEKGKKQKVWTITSYPKTEKEGFTYMRSRRLSEGRELYQFTTWDKEKEILLCFGKRPNDSTLVFYALTDEAMEKAKQTTALKALGAHVRFQKDEIHFDSIAAVDRTPEILHFLDSEMNHNHLFESDSLVFRGSHSPKLPRNAAN